MKESPENCPFCKIVKGKLPVSLIFEDDRVAIFPVLQPVNEGHVIIIPKKHCPYFEDLDEETTAYIMKLAKRMDAAIRKSKLKCDGVNLFLADGEAAHQEVFHFHLHVYPRFVGDGFGFKFDDKKHFLHKERAELDSVAGELKKFFKP